MSTARICYHCLHVSQPVRQAATKRHPARMACAKCGRTVFFMEAYIGCVSIATRTQSVSAVSEPKHNSTRAWA